MSPRSRRASRFRVVDLSVVSGEPSKLGFIQPAQGQPFSQHDPLDAPGPAVEDHGRTVTASSRAATWYRQAQRAIDGRRATAALRLAVEADPAFAPALADLDAMTGTSSQRHTRRQMNWERLTQRSRVQIPPPLLVCAGQVPFPAGRGPFASRELL
jgi:hypothetical protein